MAVGPHANQPPRPPPASAPSRRPAARRRSAGPPHRRPPGPHPSNKHGGPPQRRVLTLLASQACALLWALPAAAQEGEVQAAQVQPVEVPASDAIDLSRITVQQNFGYLTTAIPAAGSADVYKRAYTSETQIAYTASDRYRLAVSVPASLTTAGNMPAGTSQSLAWNGIAVRNLFMTPHAGQNRMFFDLGVEFAYMAPGARLPALAGAGKGTGPGAAPGTGTGAALSAGLTPIVGFHHGGYALTVTSIVAFELGAGGTASLAPAARLTRTIAEGFDVGIEYNGMMGQIGAFAPLDQQSHVVYAVADVGVAGFNLNLGVGFGLTSASNGLAVRVGIGRGF